MPFFFIKEFLIFSNETGVKLIIAHYEEPAILNFWYWTENSIIFQEIFIG